MMARFGTRAAMLTAIALICATAAFAQQAGVPAEREKIEIGLSTDKVAITSDFAGADLTIFGALDNTDPLVRRQNRYDIVMVLEGPQQPLTLRQKQRFFGMWINMDSRTFLEVPSSYALSSTRPLRDLAEEKTLKLLSLGVDNLGLPSVDGGYRVDEDAQFASALRGIKRRTELYNERIGDVQFLSANLFRATLSLPANVPIGVHRARAYLFKNGMFVTETSTQLEIRKSGFEQMIYEAAHQRGFFYGMFSVALAMLTGWLGRLIFQRD
jgi:uncharacterized protein (TIGR02186 family)